MAARAPDSIPIVRRLSYKVYLFLAVIVLMVALVVHTNTIITRLNAETRARCDVLARFFAVVTFQAAEDPNIRPIFRDAVESINFPIVLTDLQGIPRVWKEIEIPSDAIPDSVLDSAALTGVQHEEVSEDPGDRAEAGPHQQTGHIVRVRQPGVLGFVHYGEPKLVHELRWLPYIELFVILVLLVFGYAGSGACSWREQRILWAALAKETAHQLGTPLSSLMGWTALHSREPSRGVEAGTPRRDRCRRCDRDLARLHKVTLRFGQVGSRPMLKLGDLTAVVAGRGGLLPDAAAAGGPRGGGIGAVRSHSASARSTPSSWSGSSRISCATRSMRWTSRRGSSR